MVAIAERTWDLLGVGAGRIAREAGSAVVERLHRALEEWASALFGSLSARGEDHRSRHFSTLPARTLVRSIHRVGLFVGEEKTLAWITPFVVTLVNDKLWSVRAEFKRASPLLGALIGEDYLTPLANVVTS